MANAKEFELLIKLAGMIDPSLESSIEKAKLEMQSMAKVAKDASRGGVTAGEAFSDAGAGIDGMWNGAKATIRTTAEVLLAAGAAATLAGSWALNAGSNFESAFAGVEKTVDGTEKELEALEEQIRRMSKEKPLTASELAEIAESAGQLGIQIPNIVGFTGVMADLSVATNLAREEGASQLAKFANITGMVQDKFGNLGSTVVDLGNHMATTEADIMNMGMRLAGAGTQVGMSEADIMGLAASLSSVGIEAEAGGSAMSKVMIQMQLAVEKGGGALGSFAKVANMSTANFKKAFKQDAAGAITAFISGLGDTERLGKSAIEVLDDMEIKEVRLRDTLLRAAGASGTFSGAIAMANKAFEENTALSKEAEKRYATFESRVDMVGNRINDLGITLYQDFRDPLSEVLNVATQAADEVELFDPAFIEKAAQGFKDNIPTMIRNLREAGDTIEDFARPFMALGDWMLEHPDVIVGALAGIGTTIATLKLGKSIYEVTTSITGLIAAMASNPVTAAIGIVALAGGAMVGLSTQIKMAQDRARKARLDKDFGNITLSIKEMQEAVEHILDTGNRGNLTAFVEQMGELEKAAGELSKHEKVFEKINWKFGVGLELSESDLETYGRSVNEYAQSAIDWVEQEHYTATIAIQGLFKNGGGEGILKSLDKFYAETQAEINALGMQVGEEWKKAMEDGMFSPIEQETINGLLRQIADIKSSIAQAESEAQWSAIEIEGKRTELTLDSFLDLQKMAGEQKEKDKETYRGEYASAVANTKNLPKDERDKEIERINKAYEERLEETDQKYNSAIMETVAEGIKKRFNELKKDFYVTDQISEQDNLQNIIFGQLDIGDFNDVTKGEIKKQWNNLKPKLQDLLATKKSYEEMGQEIPESVLRGIKEAAISGALNGELVSMWLLLEENLSGPEFLNLQQKMKEAGIANTKALAKGLMEDQGEVKKNVDDLYHTIGRAIRERFENGTINIPVHYQIDTINKTANTGYVLPTLPEGPNGRRIEPAEIAKHATGGIFDSPHYGLFAEAGPEAIIPLDGSSNAIGLWKNVGKKLGLFDYDWTGGSNTGGDAGSQTNNQDQRQSQIVYSPVYNIAGGNEETVKKATADDYQRFERFMQQYQKNQSRLAF